MKTLKIFQTTENQIRQPSARCHWSRENIPLTRFDFPIYPPYVQDFIKTP